MNGFRVQFSLRRLFVVTALAAVPCCLLKMRIDRVDHQRQAASELGLIVHDCDPILGSGSQSWRTNVPRWSKRLLGESFFATPEGLWTLGDATLNDRRLCHIRDFPGLRWIELPDTAVTDSGLMYLARMKHLEQLVLRGTKITDKGLIHLSGLQDLRELDVSNTCVTDTGIMHLVTLKKLVKLNVAKTNVTRAGIERLLTKLPACTVDNDWRGPATGRK